MALSSLVLDASSSWDCALPVLQPTARGYTQKDPKQFWKVKEGQYCIGFPYHSTGSVVAAAAAFTAAVLRYLKEAAAACLCASNLSVIALSVLWFMLCFDVSGTEVVPSFFHGLLRDGHVLGLRFGKASARAAFFAALLDMVAHQFCSCTAAAFVGVITLGHDYVWLDCGFTVMAYFVAVWLSQQAAAACTAFEGIFTSVGVGEDAFKYDHLVTTTPSPLDYIAALSTQCASATPRVDVDAAMSGPQKSLWLENTKSHGGREEEEGKESSKEKKDPGCIPVFVRSLTGRTLKLLISPLDHG